MYPLSKAKKASSRKLESDGHSGGNRERTMIPRGADGDGSEEIIAPLYNY